MVPSLWPSLGADACELRDPHLRLPRGCGRSEAVEVLCLASHVRLLARRPLGRAAPAMNNRIRELRQARRMTQADLAVELDVSRQTVNALEAGRWDPSLVLAFAIARFSTRPSTRCSSHRVAPRADQGPRDDGAAGCKPRPDAERRQAGARPTAVSRRALPEMVNGDAVTGATKRSLLGDRMKLDMVQIGGDLSTGESRRRLHAGSTGRRRRGLSHSDLRRPRGQHVAAVRAGQ